VTLLKPARDLMRRYQSWLRARRRRGKSFLPSWLRGTISRTSLLLLASLLVLGVVFVVALRYTSPVQDGTQLRLDDVIRAAQDQAVVSATLHDVDHRITGTIQPGTIHFWSSYPASDAETPNLVETFVRGGSQVQVDSQTDKQVVRFVATYILPLVLLANLFALIFVAIQGIGSSSMGGLAEFSGIGRGRGRKHTDEDRTTFADVAGADYALTELIEVVDYLRAPEKFAALGARPPKGVMLFGPPGCGKTLMSRAIAGEAGVPFFSISGAEFVESLVGVGAARVRDLFRQVRMVAPAIVFIDEIDAAGRRRGGVSGGQEEREQTLNQLLIEMDGFETTEGMVVIGATNRPDILDPALLRPGRFDRQVTVEPPDLEGRQAILALYAKRRPVEPDVDLHYFARRTPGFTGADLSAVVNEAALLAVRQGKATMSVADFEDAVHRVLVGPRRRGHLLSDEERQRAAYHECAHVLVAAITDRLPELPRVTIVAHGRNIAATLGRSWAERTLITRRELVEELVTVMAGTAAEEMVFGEASTGADADLERATQVASLMVGRYGMGKTLGRAHLLRVDGAEFLGGELQPTELVSPEVLDRLHAEVNELLDSADAHARTLLDRHRAVLDELVTQLLDKETLEGSDLEPILAPFRAPRSNGALSSTVAPRPAAPQETPR